MKKTADFLKENMPFVKLRKNHALMTWDDTEYKIPSDLFPVLNKPSLRYFSYADTDTLGANTELARIYDSLEFKVGFCYSNIEQYSEALKKAGLKNFKIYTGWVITYGLPVHHCWLVWDDKHVIDPGVTLVENAYLLQAAELKKNNPEASMDEMRELFVSIHKKYESANNTEYRTFGKVAPFAFYIGTETTPVQGRKIFNKLMKDYPEHPSYARGGMNGQGESTLQTMLRNS